MEIIKLSKEKAKRMIENGGESFLLVSYDLQHDKFIQKKRINKYDCGILIIDSKTIVLSVGSDGEDDFSVISLYSEKQIDMKNIKPYGIKNDILIIGKM